MPDISIIETPETILQLTKSRCSSGWVVLLEDMHLVPLAIIPLTVVADNGSRVELTGIGTASRAGIMAHGSVWMPTGEFVGRAPCVLGPKPPGFHGFPFEPSLVAMVGNNITMPGMVITWRTE